MFRFAPALALVLVAPVAAAQVAQVPPPLPPPEPSTTPEATPPPPPLPAPGPSAPPAVAPCPEVDCTKKKEDKSSSKDRADMGALVAEIGLRGFVQHLSGTDRNGSIAGAGVGAHFFGNLGYRALSARIDFRAHLGGSGAGLDGHYAQDWSFGPRLRLGNHFALLGRLGASGQILGNGRLLWWTIALPELDLGGHGGGGPLFIEATGLAGITLGGNFLLGDDGARKIGTAPHVGARATIGLGPVVATATWRHILEAQHAPETPLDTVDGGLCGVFSKKYVGFTLCADGRVMRGAVNYPNGASREGTAFYGGISVSVGVVGAAAGSMGSLWKK